MKRMANEKQRTAGGGAGPEDPLDLRVHHDADLSLVLDSGVPSVHPLSDSVLKVLADDRFDHTCDVSTRQLEDLLSLAGQCPHGLSVRVPLGVLDEVLDRHVVEVRHLDHLHLVAADASALVAA